ncbi:hypothetical protein H6G22_09445 [Desertifilum sp. FACHB-868]|nr:hypothetical protein [Desertifilum sp. FACHB-868]
MSAMLILGTVSCGDRAEAPPGLPLTSNSTSQTAKNIAEVSPPEVIQQLRQTLEVYQPQVKILSPQLNEVLTDTSVSVRLQVQDLPLFKDEKWGLGPHLHVILDNQPYKAVYDTSQPLVFEDLSPGTHTIRAFASRPWHESFKNEGAYAQTTFHIFARTQDNDPELKKPLLTYSRPVGTYGAEPILLDYYLTNAPLHLVAQEKPNDDILDWKIRATVNGESFIIDQWQPLYLKGFKPGKNWVELELLDEFGNPIENEFNNTVRLITYEPRGKDTLAKLTRGELSASEVRSIVDRSYTAPPSPVVPTPVPTPKAFPTLPEIVESPEPEVQPSETPQPTSFFNRFRQPKSTAPTVLPSQPEVAPSLPEVLETPSPEPEVELPLPEVQPSETPQPTGLFNRFRQPKSTAPTVLPSQPEVAPSLPEVLETPSPEPEVELPLPEVQPSETPQPTGLFNRFRQPKSTAPTVLPSQPEVAPSLPEVLETPSPEPEIELPLPEVQPSETPQPEATPASEPNPPGNFLNRLRQKREQNRLLPTPSAAPTLPEIVETPIAEPSPEPSIEESLPTPQPEITPEAASTPLPLIQPTASPKIPSRYFPASPEASPMPELQAEEPQPDNL